MINDNDTQHLHTEMSNVNLSFYHWDDAQKKNLVIVSHLIKANDTCHTQTIYICVTTVKWTLMIASCFFVCKSLLYLI